MKGRYSRALHQAHYDEGQKTPQELFKEFCSQQGWLRVGPSSNWSLSAFQINSMGHPKPYGKLAWDNEDGTFSVVTTVPEGVSKWSPSEEEYYGDPESFQELFRGDFDEFRQYVASAGLAKGK